MIFLPSFWSKPVINKWMFISPYSGNRFGLWPLHIWFYNRLSRWDHQIYGVAFHFLWIADCHIEIEY